MATPANNSGLLIVADRKRKATFDVRMGEADGDDVAVVGADNVRVKIGNGKATPLLEIQSDAPTANGSSCTAANPTRIVLDQDDMTMPAGIYDIEVSIVDSADGDTIKKDERGIIHVRESMGGAVT